MVFRPPAGWSRRTRSEQRGIRAGEKGEGGRRAARQSLVGGSWGRAAVRGRGPSVFCLGKAGEVVEGRKRQYEPLSDV